MEIKQIESGIKRADKIYHVSDIHIRTLKRHAEYRLVFNNLFKEINSTATKNSIAVITGDIVHSKLDMSPELVEMLVEFFNGFTIPTLVILGNHDMNLNNLHRKDAVSPIINVLQNKNIYFIKENGLFEFAGLVFNHMAVDVDPVNYIRAHEFDAQYRKIALHHGAVNSAKTEIGFEISNDHVSTDIFGGHDMTLLGDIHKPGQFLSDTVAYAGSLIQQSYGETLGHGILVWDVESCTAEFKEIKNEYGYITYELISGKIHKKPESVPQRPRIRIKFHDTSASDIKKFITTLRKKYNVEDISIQRINGADSKNIEFDITIGNVRDIEYQNKLITEYINSNFPAASSEEIDAVRHINRVINSKLPKLESVRHATWHPVSYEFSNMFSYGENNIIDFTKLHDVVGLFASNATGKSSLLDAITYTCFDKCSKTGKAREVLNNKKSSFFGRFCFELNNEIYTIERIGTKKKDGHVKVDVNFFTNSMNLNGNERSETNDNIRKYLGTYDDFILTAFSLQNDNNNFIQKSQRERKDLLSQFLDITVFEQLYLLASDEIKSTQGQLKEYKKIDFATLLSECDRELQKLQDFIITEELKENEISEFRNELQNKILELIETKRYSIYDGYNIDILQQQEEKLISIIEQMHEKISKHEEKIQSYITKRKDLERQCEELNLEHIQKTLISVEEIQETIANHRSKIEALRQDIKTKETKLHYLDTHEYDPNCKYCVSNPFVKEALLFRDLIEPQKKELQEYELLLKNKEQELSDLNWVFTSYDQYKLNKELIQRINTELKTLQLQLQIYETDILTKESELETNAERQDLYQKNKETIVHNSNIDLEISKLKQLVEHQNIQLKTIIDKIKVKHGEVQVQKTKKENFIFQLETFKRLEIEFKAYEYYLESVKRNGVPYDIISKALPKIEAEINNVLSQIVDFNMTLETDGKNINGYIIYDEDNFWPLELTSGMERFVSSLAIRIALINISALPRPNFIAIDEGWGSLDQEHISSVANLFDYFKNKFDFSIIISHVDTMRDMVDMLLEVNKNDDYSYIQHT
jgi:DNA repair exonuclease SbcCD ATPase subunit